MIYDGGATFGTVQLCGQQGLASFRFADTYTAFRRQLVAFVEFLRNGQAALAAVDEAGVVIAATG